MLVATTPAPGQAPIAPQVRAGQARVLFGVLAVLAVLVIGLALISVLRRVARRQVLSDRLAEPKKVRRRQRSAWVEAGKRARPVEPDGSLPLNDEPRDKDDLEDTH